MKKNNKGFTLIELLAALVILGLLVMLGLPRLTEAITSSKDKVYVSDAKRLIAQTEYKVKVNSSVVELPSESNCIVVGLKYLDASDFDSPPNDGKYLEDQSFAIIKNNSGKFEYSARLVEMYKNGKGYKGVDLSKSSALDYKGGLSCVKAFNEDDLSDDVLTMENSDLQTYINNALGDGYCFSVENIYNEYDLQGSSSSQDNDAPKISSATLTSTGNVKNFNSFNFTLRLKADDDDGRENLNVCLSFDSYDDAKQHCMAYNDSVTSTGIFTQDYDLSAGRSYNEDNEPVTLYIIVKDSNGSFSKREVTYEFHKNEAPVIDRDHSSIAPSDESSINDVNTVLTLSVSDDITDVGNLMVCFDEGDYGRCRSDSEYKPYSSFFGNGNSMDYKIDASSLDGSTRTIIVYVKDEFGISAEPIPLYYTLHKSTAPDFQETIDNKYLSVSPVNFSGVTDGSLKVRVKFKLLDNLDNVPTSKMKVKIKEVGCSDSRVQCEKTYDYTGSNSGYDYLFGGLKSNYGKSVYEYDGASRKLEVTVYNVDDPSDNNYAIVDYNVYGNTRPRVTLLNYQGEGFDACVPGYRCDAYQRNTKDLKYIIGVEDDIDSSETLKYCVSDTESYCSDDSHFVSFNPAYVELSNSFVFTGELSFNVDPERPYLGEIKNLFFVVKDSYGLTTGVGLTGGYKLYENQAPFIDLLEISDSSDHKVSSGGLDVTISPKLYSNDHLMFDLRDHGGSYYFADDLTDNKYLGYELYVDDELLHDGEDSDNVFSLTIDEINQLKSDPNTNWDDILTFDKLLNQDLQIHLDPKMFPYNGGTHTFKLVLTDSYGERSEFTADYQMYNNKPPVIDRFQIAASSSACESCGTEGGYTVDLNVSLSDDIDNSNNLFVCLDENLDNCTDERFISYSEFFENKLYKYTFKGADTLTPYNGQTKTLYIAVRDSMNGKSFDEVKYTVYSNEAPTVDSSVSVSSQDSHFDSRAAVFNSTVHDDFNNLYERVCYSLNTGEEDYVPEYVCDNDFRPYDKHFKFDINTSEYSGQTYTLYAEIMDDYGEMVTTNLTTYTVSSDSNPVVNEVSGMIDVPGYTNQGVVSFKVTDYGDSVKACVVPKSTGASGCNYVSTSYDGSTGNVYTYVYSYGSNQPSTSTNYSLYVKDSHGKVASKDFKFVNYTAQNECDNPITDTINVTYTPVDNNKIINSDRCMGRCYYWNKEVSDGKVVKEASDTFGIYASYRKDFSYRSRYNENKFCNNSSGYVSLNCGSIECFNTGTSSSKNYNNNYVIGMEEHISHEDWFYIGLDGEQHLMTAGSRYFNMYTTSYHNGDEYVTLNKTNYYIPADYINDYAYSVDSSVKYLRALDSEDIVLSKPVVNSAVSKAICVDCDEEAGLQVGNVVAIGNETYHIVKKNINGTVDLFADYNYFTGNYFDPANNIDMFSGGNSYCQQDPDSKAWNENNSRIKGYSSYSYSPFWVNLNGNLNSLYGTSYPANIPIESPVNGCFGIIRYDFEKNHIDVKTIRLLTYNEAYSLGCREGSKSCPSWMSTGTYWLGTAADSENVFAVYSDGSLRKTKYDSKEVGRRYVITISSENILVG